MVNDVRDVQMPVDVAKVATGFPSYMLADICSYMLAGNMLNQLELYCL